jgi:branched-chain amino acid transport system substrate-binding protein
MVVLLLASLVLGGCQRDKPPAPEQLIKIGVIFPFSGPDGATGSDLQAGVELALEIINQDYELTLPLAPGKGLTRHGARLQAIYRDSGNDPILASRSVEELVINERVKALIGGYTSVETTAISEQTEIMQVPLLNCTSTSPRLTQMGLQWFFRITPDDSFFAQNFFQFLQELQENQPGSIPHRLVLVYENGIWGTGVAQAQRKLAKKYDYEIVADVPYNARETSFEKMSSNSCRDLGPKTILFQASYERDAILLMQGYKARHIQPTAILAMDAGFISPGFIKTLGSEAEHILSREVWAKDISARKPLAALINNLFRQRYGRDLTGNSARSFTGTLVLADALNRAASLTPRAIREALLQTDIPTEQIILPWQGVKFDPQTGQNLLGGGIIVQLQHGEYRTVWPKDFAVSQVIWPLFAGPAPETQP